MSLNVLLNLLNEFKGQTQSTAQQVQVPNTKFCTTKRTKTKYCATNSRTKHKVLCNKLKDQTQVYYTINPCTKHEVLRNKFKDQTQNTVL